MKPDETTELDWLALLNALIPRAASGKGQAVKMTELDERFDEAGLDSLDTTILLAYVCELFALPHEEAKQMMAHTPAQLHAQVLALATRHIESVEAAIAILDQSP